VTDLGNELKGSSEGKIVSIMEDFEHQIDGLGIKVCPQLPLPCDMYCVPTPVTVLLASLCLHPLVAALCWSLDLVPNIRHCASRG